VKEFTFMSYNAMPFDSDSLDSTRSHAGLIAAECSGGTVLRLHGTLGAGKTTWVQGFVAGLGATMEVTSPTFALLHEYRGGRLDVFHWDLYRLESETDWSVLDLPEQLPSSGLTLIEWPERYPGPWPQGCLIDVQIKTLSETQRRIFISRS